MNRFRDTCLNATVSGQDLEDRQEDTDPNLDPELNKTKLCGKSCRPTRPTTNRKSRRIS